MITLNYFTIGLVYKVLAFEIVTTRPAPCKKLPTASGNGNNNNEDDDSYGLYHHDDDYYLDIGSEPPRFAYYRHIRIEKSKRRIQKEII
jgi:hypothetical protein